MKRSISTLVVILGAMLLTGSIAMASGRAPEGKTYFIYIMGLEDDPYEASADCLEFDASQACSLDGQICLNWERTEGNPRASKDFGLSFAAEIDDDGLVITFEGQGRVQARGRRSSLSAVGRAAALDVQLNFVFSGREVGKNRCRGMVEDFFATQAAAH